MLAVCYGCGKKRRKLRSSGRCRQCDNWEKHQRQRRNSWGIKEGYVAHHRFIALCNSFGNRCVACGQHRKHLQLDHVVPYAAGGTHELDNIQPLCGSCNKYKSIKTIDFRPYAMDGQYLWSAMPHAVAARRAFLRRFMDDGIGAFI